LTDDYVSAFAKNIAKHFKPGKLCYIVIGGKICNFLLGNGQSCINSNVTPYSFHHKIPAAHTRSAPKKMDFIYF